jgi:hypothetical protein
MGAVNLIAAIAFPKPESDGPWGNIRKITVPPTALVAPLFCLFCRARRAIDSRRSSVLSASLAPVLDNSQS